MENVKKGMSDEERIQLAGKLDRELDEFIANLPRRPPQEERPPLDENWFEEFDNHPFFMKKVPEAGEKMHPLYEGLQQLKYDPNENTPEELALSYKEDGNFNFKHKNYRLAVLGYTEGIKVKCPSDDVNASLHNNRAAANMFLKNYRSCIRDCELALKLKPDYEKAAIRAANATFAIEQFEKCVEFCDRVLQLKPECGEVLELRRKCVAAGKNKLRDERKREAAAKRKLREEAAVVAEIVKRGVRLEEKKDTLRLEMLEPRFPELANHRVFLSDDGKLIWPVVFVYPEYQIMDFVQQFSEDDLFQEQIESVFAETPEWDREKSYKVGSLRVYYENAKGTRVFEVDLKKSLLEVLQGEAFVIRGGTPSFIVFVKGSQPEATFLQKY